jgi:hypothetical protein
MHYRQTSAWIASFDPSEAAEIDEAAIGNPKSSHVRPRYTGGLERRAIRATMENETVSGEIRLC